MSIGLQRHAATRSDGVKTNELALRVQWFQRTSTERSSSAERLGPTLDGSDPFGRATKDPCGDAAHGPAHVAAGCPPDWRRSFRLLLLRALPAGRWESALTNSGRLCVSRGSGPIPAVRDSTPWGPRDSRGVLSCFSLNCNQIMRWPQPPSHPHGCLLHLCGLFTDSAAQLGGSTATNYVRPNQMDRQMNEINEPKEHNGRKRSKEQSDQREQRASSQWFTILLSLMVVKLRNIKLTSTTVGPSTMAQSRQSKRPTNNGTSLIQSIGLVNKKRVP